MNGIIYDNETKERTFLFPVGTNVNTIDTLEVF